MKRNPYAKYLGKEDILQTHVMRYISLKYPKALYTHVANEGKRTPFEQYKLKILGTKPGIPDLMGIINLPKTKKTGLNGLKKLIG